MRIIRVPIIVTILLTILFTTSGSIVPDQLTLDQGSDTWTYNQTANYEDNYIFNVTNYSVNDTMVITTGDGPLDIRTGSNISILLFSNFTDYDFFDSESTINSYLRMKVDGEETSFVTLGISFITFLYPTSYTPENGTTENPLLANSSRNYLSPILGENNGTHICGSRGNVTNPSPSYTSACYNSDTGVLEDLTQIKNGTSFENLQISRFLSLDSVDPNDSTSTEPTRNTSTSYEDTYTITYQNTTVTRTDTILQEDPNIQDTDRGPLSLWLSLTPVLFTIIIRRQKHKS